MCIGILDYNELSALCILVFYPYKTVVAVKIYCVFVIIFQLVTEEITV